MASSTPCEAVASARKSQTVSRRPRHWGARNASAVTTAPSATAKVSECVRPRWPSMWPQGTPNQRPTTSRSGTIAHAAPASQKRAGGPGRRNSVPSAAPTTACEKTDGTVRLRAQDQVEVEQVRVRRARDDTIVAGAEKRVGVVVRERALGILAGLAPAADGAGVDATARRVGRPVRAVGAGGPGRESGGEGKSVGIGGRR